MAIVFGQVITAGNGAASGSFTPAASSSVFTVGYNTSGGDTLTCAGTGTYLLLTPPGQFAETNFNSSWALFSNLSATTSAQTATCSGSGGTENVFGIVYSGVTTVAGNAHQQANPGSGAGAVVGVATVVATGAVLVAMVCCMTNSADTLTNVGGTTRGAQATNAGGCYLFADYAGSGGSITPQFTAALGTANDYVVMQFLLSPPGAAPSVIAWIT